MSPHQHMSPQQLAVERPSPQSQRADSHRGRQASTAKHLPKTFAIWWMATIAFIMIASTTVAFYGLKMMGIEVTLDDPQAMIEQKKFVWVIGGSVLGVLFLVWVAQNAAKAMTRQKPNPELSYNNLFGILICVMIAGTFKFASDTVTAVGATTDDAQLEWLRANAYEPGQGGRPEEKRPEPSAAALAAEDAEGQPSKAANDEDGEQADEPAEASTQTTTPRSTTQPRATRTSSGSSDGVVRLGDPVRPILAEAMRTVQRAEGAVRTAEQTLAGISDPNVSSRTTAAQLQKTAGAYRSAAKPFKAFARLGIELSPELKAEMIEAGVDEARASNESIDFMVLMDVGSKSAVRDAQARVLDAKAAYLEFLASHVGEWKVVGGQLEFENPVAGEQAAQLRTAMARREMELAAAE